MMPKHSLANPPLSVLIVSYNTRAMTLSAIRTLRLHTRTPIRVLVWDNASTDGSAEAITAAFPDIHLVSSPSNIGFARANNRLVEFARTPWILLLNPDTELRTDAVDQLLSFAKTHPRNGIYGGRTIFADAHLNPGSAWMRITGWSSLCAALGLSTLLRHTTLFNPEGIGGWARNTMREVDIVQGSFLLIRRAIWRDLGGFREHYFMYGEEADLCLRAIARGYRPVIAPNAEIVHHAGAASPDRGDRQILLSRARATLIRDHWKVRHHDFGIGCMVMGSLVRRLAYGTLGQIAPARFATRARAAAAVWHARREWRRGYGRGTTPLAPVAGTLDAAADADPEVSHRPMAIPGRSIPR